VTLLGNRTTSVSIALILFALSGCAAGPHPADGTLDSRSAEPAPKLDPTRAFVPFSKIEPAVQPPTRPESLKPLSERAAKRIAPAQKLVQQQRYTEAAIELERALRYDPNHPEINRTLAVLHWQAGNLERAKSHVRRTLEVNPDDSEAHYILGRCKASDGDYAAAMTAYRTALLCSDFDSRAETAALCHYHLAEALEAEGYLEAALSQYAAFKERASAPDADDALAGLLQSRRRPMADARSKILERLDRYAEAAEALSPLLADSPDDVALGSRCARLWMRAGRHSDALEVARAIRSDDEELIQLLFEIHERAGQPEQIVGDLRARLAERPDEPRLTLNLAEALTRLDRINEATRELERFLAGHPDAGTVRMRLVDLLITQSAWDELLACCEDGIKRQPARAPHFEARIAELATNERAVEQLLGPKAVSKDAGHLSTYLRGILAKEAGRIQQAETFLRQSCTADHAFVPARAALAEIYLDAYRYDEALATAARPNQDVPEDARLEYLLGQIYERLDDLEQAGLHFKAAIQLDRNDAEVMLALAKVLRRSGEANRAQLQLRVLLGQRPDHEEARETLVFTYWEEGKVDAAIEQLEKLRDLSTTPSVRARCEALLAQVDNPDPDTYRQTLIDSMEDTEPDADTLLLLGDSYAELEPKKAREAYVQALATDPKNEDAVLGLVRVEQSLLNFEAAAAHLESLLPRRPNRHNWRRTLIDLYTVFQDYEASLALGRRLEARNDLDKPTRQAYRNRVIRSLRRLGREEQVLEQLKAWADADPEDREAAIQLASEYIDQDQTSKAVPIFKAHHESNRDDEFALAQLIAALVADGRHERAYQYALDWLHEDAESDQALGVLITVLADAGRTDDALELIKSRLLRTQEREQFQDLTGVLLRQAERHDESINLIERLIDEVVTLIHRISEAQGPGATRPEDERLIHQPDEPDSLNALTERLDELRWSLARGLLLAKEYREAEQLLAGLVNASGDRKPRVNFEYLKLLAYAQQLQGNDQQAAQTLELALLLKFDDVGLNNDVAYGWIDRGVRLAEAEHMIRLSLSRVPTEAAYLDTYAWLLYKKGAFADAKKWLLRATRARDNTDGVILDHLGDTCWRLGDKEEAIQHWTSAIATIKEGDQEGLTSDERRVRDTTQQKIDDARKGLSPNVAPLAAPPQRENAEDSSKT
jgi:tetratricopeptide (TPR) repeat protein